MKTPSRIVHKERGAATLSAPGFAALRMICAAHFSQLRTIAIRYPILPFYPENSPKLRGNRTKIAKRQLACFLHFP
jgi:hypothetical protein